MKNSSVNVYPMCGLVVLLNLERTGFWIVDSNCMEKSLDCPGDMMSRISL